MSQGFTSQLPVPLPVAQGGTGVTNSNWTAGSLTFSPTTQGIVGTTTNDNAAAGYVGELVTSQVNQGSGVSLSNGIAANVTSISLTAGDWDVWGNFNITATGSTTIFFGWTSNTSATSPNAAFYTAVAGSAGGQGIGMPVPYRRVSLSGTTTVYLSCQANFSSGTATGSGGIFARRAR